jgi:hypothetical protein
MLRSHKAALLDLLTPPPLSAADREGIAEAIAERSAIIEHDAHQSLKAAETQARTAMRVYRIRVAMGANQPTKWVTLVAPGCDLAAATETARGQFGASRVLEVREQERRP